MGPSAFAVDEKHRKIQPKVTSSIELTSIRKQILKNDWMMKGIWKSTGIFQKEIPNEDMVDPDGD